jgi:hypothetical protein
MVNITAERLKKYQQKLDEQTILTEEGAREPTIAERLGLGFKLAIEEAKKRKEKKKSK